MREIDEVRITLLRLFRGAVRLPEEIIDEMLKAFLHTQDAAIKVQAYGRGLLQRFRSHRLITKDFNRQASREYQEYLTAWQGFNNPAGYLDDMRHPFLHGYRFARDHEIDISQDMEGISAKWHTRAHRESRKALAYRIRRAHRVVGRADQEHSCWIQNRNILASLPGGEVVYYRLATTLIQHLGGLWAHNNLLST